MQLRVLWTLSAIFLLLTSCTQPMDGGVGSTLAYSGMQNQTIAQESYVNLICKQAGAVGGYCPDNWRNFVLAGMNDIDERCDAYLSWLDERRRLNSPIQKQIADTSTVTATIMAASSAPGQAIGIVAAAFGFARNSFDNSQSRLLMEVNHSTVQTIVLSSQDKFRKQLNGVTVDNRPLAIYVLRQYLRLCMPYTIENEINTTITTYQLGGADALRNAEDNPLIAISSLRSRIAPTDPIGRRQVVYPKPNPIDAYLLDPKAFSPAIVKKAFLAICVTEKEIDNPTQNVSALIKVMQQWRRDGKGVKAEVINGKLSNGDISAMSEEAPCRVSLTKNYYEKTMVPDGIISIAADLIPKLNARLADGQRLSETATEADIRRAISIVRSGLSSRLELNDPAISTQLTSDFFNKV